MASPHSYKCCSQTQHHRAHLMSATSSTGETRLRWLPLTKTTMQKGERIVTYPFLDDSNYKDREFVKTLLVERPYKAGFGHTGKAWDEVAISLSGQRHPETGDLLFGDKGLKAKALKDRFMAFMDFVKKEDSAAPRRTGTDDEAEPHEIMQGLEDLHEDWLSHSANGESKNISAVAQKKKDRELAEALRQSALIGNISAVRAAIRTGAADEEEEDEGDIITTPTVRRTLSTTSSGRSSGPTSSSRSKSPVPDSQGFLLQLAARSEERDEERARSKRVRAEIEDRKEERDAKRLQLEEQRMQLERDRLELDRTQRMESRDERKASAALMQALALSLLRQNQNDNVP